MPCPFIHFIPDTPAEPLPGTLLVHARFEQQAYHPALFAQHLLPPVEGATKHQAEHLAGRLCARAALQRGGLPAARIGRDQQGVPLWPAGWVGSISHGGGQAVALLGADTHWQGLGVDLERQLAPARALRLASGILGADELARSPGHDAMAFAEHLTLVFSLKESLFKALYPLVRRYFHFHHAELLDAADGRARLRLLIDLHPDWPAGRELEGHYLRSGEHLLSLIGVPAARSV